MNQYEQEKQDLKEQPQNTIEAAKKNQYCTKPFGFGELPPGRSRRALREFRTLKKTDGR